MADTPSTYGTPFVETEALLATQEKDEETLHRLLDSMSDREREALYVTCKRLARRILYFED